MHFLFHLFHHNMLIRRNFGLFFILILISLSILARGRLHRCVIRITLAIMVLSPWASVAFGSKLGKPSTRSVRYYTYYPVLCCRVLATVFHSLVCTKSTPSRLSPPDFWFICLISWHILYTVWFIN
jgi:hypothetical protein